MKHNKRNCLLCFIANVCLTLLFIGKGIVILILQVILKVKDSGIVFKKQCIEKYCSCDKVCQFTALLVISCRSYLEKSTIDD